MARSRFLTLEPGVRAVVDAEDYDRLQAHEWKLVRVGPYAYAGRRHQHEVVYLQREVLAPPRRAKVLFNTSDTLDCRKANLHVSDKWL